jgi:hypothetical protein
MQKSCVFFEVRTEFLYRIQTVKILGSLRKFISHFVALYCIICFSINFLKDYCKGKISLYNIGYNDLYLVVFSLFFPLLLILVILRNNLLLGNLLAT